MPDRHFRKDCYTPDSHHTSIKLNVEIQVSPAVALQLDALKFQANTILHLTVLLIKVCKL